MQLSDRTSFFYCLLNYITDIIYRGFSQGDFDNFRPMNITRKIMITRRNFIIFFRNHKKYLFFKIFFRQFTYNSERVGHPVR
ncbi:hypothetical protein KOXM_16228 [Klebsiella michiganensis]|nr:hypothetical protein KOXM_16228 [Klebsiella michiganensis]